jgi:hypothetical protein
MRDFQVLLLSVLAVIANNQQLAAIGQQTEAIPKYGPAWARTCVVTGAMFGDLDPQRVKDLNLGNTNVCALLR